LRIDHLDGAREVRSVDKTGLRPWTGNIGNHAGKSRQSPGPITPSQPDGQPPAGGMRNQNTTVVGTIDLHFGDRDATLTFLEE
jgi:hypothetical protein